MTLNIQYINQTYIIGDNYTESSGLIEGKSSTLEHLFIPTFSSDNQRITEIGSYAFFSYTNIIHVTMSPSIEYIHAHSFQFCKKMISINIPTTTKYIANNAFDDCFELKQFTFDSPSSIISLGNYTFNTCLQLEEITLPPSLKEIKTWAFSGILTHLKIYYQGRDPLLSSKNNEVFYNMTKGYTIYVPMNGVSTFCGEPTVKVSFLPRIPRFTISSLKFQFPIIPLVIFII